MAFVLFSASAYAATVTVPIQEVTMTFTPPPGSGGAPVTDCVGKTTTATTNQMAILAPCSRNVITANQKTAPALIAMDITDANAAVNAGLIPVSVQALGMQNVEVWTHGSMAVNTGLVPVSVPSG